MTVIVRQVALANAIFHLQIHNIVKYVALTWELGAKTGAGTSKMNNLPPASSTVNNTYGSIGNSSEQFIN